MLQPNFKDVNKALEQLNNENLILTSLEGIPDLLWCYNNQSLVESCCFNHWIGRPIKADISQILGIADYEMTVYKEMLQFRRILVNKFAGAGMTEWFLRVMLYLASKGKTPYRQFAIITGTQMDLAIQLLKHRLERNIINVKRPNLIKSSVKNTVELYNGYYFKAYPTDHVDDLRGQDDLAFIFVDEAGFFHPNDQEEIYNAIKRYTAKTNPIEVWNTTPKGAVGAFYNLFMDALKDKNGYHPIILNWELGANFGLIDRKAVEKLMVTDQRTYRQEYNNEFLAPIGAALPIDITQTGNEAIDL